MKGLLSTALCSLIIGLSGGVLADQGTTDSDSVEESAAQVPSIIFLQYLNQQAPELLCQQDPQVACLKMPAELCQLSVQASAERCGPPLLAQWPAAFAENQANATRYAREYRNCVLQDWIDEFGLQPERLNACGITLP